MVRLSQRRSQRSAFTLIELLVVIAIIAILAAILFPVFAQARAAARGASSESNLKQLSLGIMMYTQDYDETYPLGQQWGVAGSPILVNGMLFTNWGYTTIPYLKNYQVFADPQFGGIQGNQIFTPYSSHYGYNYCALSPITNTSAVPWVPNPVTLAAVARPADMVLLSGRWAPEEGGLVWYGVGTLLSAATAEPPSCNDAPGICFSDWQAGGQLASLAGITTETAGLYTAGVSLRKALQGNFAMTDGHVKFMPAGQAAVGTNWTRLGTGTVHITTPTTYKWAVSP